MKELDPLELKRRERESRIETVKRTEGLDEELLEAFRRLDSWLKKKGRAQNTRLNYLFRCRDIFKVIPRTPDTWTAEDLEKIMRAQEHRSARTRNMFRTTIRHLLRVYSCSHLLRLSYLDPQMCTDDESLRVAMVMNSDPVNEPDMRRIITPEWTDITTEHMETLERFMPFEAAVIFWVIFDTGARPDDASSLRLGDVAWEGDIMLLLVPDETKTGSRAMPVVYSAGILKRWLASHPYRQRDSSGAYVHHDVALFLDPHGQPWTTRKLSSAFRKAKREYLKAQKSPDWKGPMLPESIRPKDLRPNATKRDLERGMSYERSAAIRGHTEAVLKQIYDKSDGRKLAAMSAAEMMGREWAPEEKTGAQWIDCPRCHSPSAPGSEYCSVCGEPLSVEVIEKKAEEVQERESRIDALERELKELKALILLQTAKEVKRGEE